MFVEMYQPIADAARRDMEATFDAWRVQRAKNAATEVKGRAVTFAAAAKEYRLRDAFERAAAAHTAADHMLTRAASGVLDVVGMPLAIRDL